MVRQRRLSALLVASLLVFVVLMAIYGRRPYLPHLSLPTAAAWEKLPLYGLYSFTRMLVAYLLSLVFSIVYGYLAATSRRAERFLVPILDVLQSVPIIGFFPAAIYLFIRLTGGGELGIELASVFLIFTSQAWNMTFGVYEAILTIPTDAREVLESFGASRWLTFKRLLLPACVPKLVYNTIMSWAGGWYFLMAAEIIAVGPVHYKLPGLGSLMYTAAEQGRIGLMLLALGTLVGIIVAMDFLLWRPLSVWAEIFRYEFTAAPPSRSQVLDWWRHSQVAHLVKTTFQTMGHIASRVIFVAVQQLRLQHLGIVVARGKRPLGWMMTAGGITVAGYLTWRAVDALIAAFSQPVPHDAVQIPLAILASLGRLTLAYLIALVWTVPLSIWIGENERVARVVTPIAEIGASIPATALFPLIVLFVIRVFGGMNAASVLLVLTGMQWYLLFNLIAGARAIPQELKEMARSFRLPRWRYWQRVVFPALLPSLLTGSITGWGGGWNALIVSEYFVYNQKIYHVLGIGALLDRATYELGNGALILLTLGAMVGIITLLNRLVWRRLYQWAARRYRLD